MDAVDVAAPAPRDALGEPLRRAESVAKVTGRLVYAADATGEAPLHAYFLTSGIARGRLRSIDTAPAKALEGVVKVYTHHNAPDSIATVRVVNPYVGGAFGGKGFMTQRTALVACAARELARPVRNVVTRDQCFTLATDRAETKHRIRLAADRRGRLLAYGHESWEMQSRHDDYPLAGFGVTTAMYGKPAIRTRANMVKADRQTSGFMRAPVEMPYMYALESAMDELAVALEMDPVELRRVNDIR